MSNYPPTPAFGGGFTMPRRPSFPVPPRPPGLQYANNVTPSQNTVASPTYQTRPPVRLSETHPPHPIVSSQAAPVRATNITIEGLAEGDREEGEVSDVEQDIAQNLSHAAGHAAGDVHMNGNSNGQTHGGFPYIATANFPHSGHGVYQIFL